MAEIGRTAGRAGGGMRSVAAFPAQAQVAAWGAGAARAPRFRGPHQRLGFFISRGPLSLSPIFLLYFLFQKFIFSISIFMCLKLVKSLSKLIFF
jgi:hypothetical protein